MDHIFSPWRYSYVSATRSEGDCVLCGIAAAPRAEDRKRFVVARGRELYVVLNVYPYNSGHLMIVPFSHVARLNDLDASARGELVELTTRAEQVLGDVYHPEGLNVGLNLGRCAGAGIADHLHVHVVPRWGADTNFMTATGETRVLPEDLVTTWEKLHGRF
jgi:ATP adenylyltransferase